MLIKFLTHGKGQAAKAVLYVIGTSDHRGILREEVKVLRGHPSMVAQVADSLTFTRGYTSGVIAWAPDDAPSEQEIGEVLDDFERLSFAGLDPDRAAWTAVLHRESEGGVHLHILVACVDLGTGKCLMLLTAHMDPFPDRPNGATSKIVKPEILDPGLFERRGEGPDDIAGDERGSVRRQKDVVRRKASDLPDLLQDFPRRLVDGDGVPSAVLLLPEEDRLPVQVDLAPGERQDSH